jgi:hypothetical protein
MLYKSVLECESVSSVSSGSEGVSAMKQSIIQPSGSAVSWESRVYSEAAVFREELQVNRSYGVGRQATSEDTSVKTRHVYSEL